MVKVLEILFFPIIWLLRAVISLIEKVAPVLLPILFRLGGLIGGLFAALLFLLYAWIFSWPIGLSWFWILSAGLILGLLAPYYFLVFTFIPIAFISFESAANADGAHGPVESDGKIDPKERIPNITLGISVFTCLLMIFGGMVSLISGELTLNLFRLTFGIQLSFAAVLPFILPKFRSTWFR